MPKSWWSIKAGSVDRLVVKRRTLLSSDRRRQM